jgi:hypothetical protein
MPVVLQSSLALAQIRNDTKYYADSKTKQVYVKTSAKIVTDGICADIKRSRRRYAVGCHKGQMWRTLAAKAHQHLYLAGAKPFDKQLILHHDP